MNNEWLTSEEFNVHLNAKTLRLSFIGMSNCGKSYRARTLKNECDFLWYQVDDDIQKELGFQGQEEISAWLGYPSSGTYAEREKKYLELEGTFTSQVAMSSHGKNLVFDTTGSIAHLSGEVHDVLRENTLVVHLDVGEDSIDEMLIRFFKDPKPVAWSGLFTKNKNQAVEDAIRRSYPTLLYERLKRYRLLAHVNIEAQRLYDTSGEETLRIIREGLSK